MTRAHGGRARCGVAAWHTGGIARIKSPGRVDGRGPGSPGRRCACGDRDPHEPRSTSRPAGPASRRGGSAHVRLMRSSLASSLYLSILLRELTHQQSRPATRRDRGAERPASMCDARSRALLRAHASRSLLARSAGHPIATQISSDHSHRTRSGPHSCSLQRASSGSRIDEATCSQRACCPSPP